MERLVNNTNVSLKEKWSLCEVVYNDGLKKSGLYVR